MGLYMEDENKDGWLVANGEFVGGGIYESHIDFDLVPKQQMLVCLVDNGMFKACGVAYTEREFKHFDIPDGRYKDWYLVDTTKLAPKCPMWDCYMGAE